MGSRPLKRGGEDCPGTLREVRRKRNGAKGRTRDCPLPLRISRKAPGWPVFGDPKAKAARGVGMRASFLRLSRRYLRQDRATEGASARAGGRGRRRPRASIAAAGRGCLACGGGGGPSRRSRRFRGASGSAGAAAYCHGLAVWAAFPPACSAGPGGGSPLGLRGQLETLGSPRVSA